MNAVKMGAIAVLAVLLATAVPFIASSSDAAPGDSENTPLTWWNSTIILLPEVQAGQITDPEHQVLEPPESLAIDWGDGQYEIRNVDGYVASGDVEIVHTYSSTGIYHIQCTPQVSDPNIRFDTYELWVEINGAPTVYFYDGETEISHVIAQNGEGVGAYEDDYFTRISEPSEPTKDGKVFAGWYLNGEEFDFNTVIKSPTVLQAHWVDEGSLFHHRISFYDGNAKIGSQDIFNDNDGSIYTTITQSNPSKDGYTFKGWSLEQNGQAQYLKGATIIVGTDGLELYAVWEQDAPVTVTVYIDGNASTFNAGSKVGDIPSPTSQGYTFAGWYSDTERTSKVSSSMVLTDGMRLYTKWNQNPTEQTDVPKDDKVVEKVVITTERKVSDLVAPEKEGYELEGWYSDEDCTIKLTDKDLAFGVNAYAKYKAVESSDSSVPVIAIAVTAIGAIIALIGFRYHPAIVVVGVIIAAIGGLDIGGIISLF